MSHTRIHTNTHTHKTHAGAKIYNKFHKLIILVPQQNSLVCYCNERHASRHSIEHYNCKQAWVLHYFKPSQATQLLNLPLLYREHCNSKYIFNKTNWKKKQHREEEKFRMFYLLLRAAKKTNVTSYWSLLITKIHVYVRYIKTDNERLINALAVNPQVKKYFHIKLAWKR